MSADRKFVILRALEEGKSMNEFAHQFNINKSTVCRISLRYRQTNYVERKPASGQPRKFIARQDCQMVKIGKVNPRKTLVDVTNYVNDQ